MKCSTCGKEIITGCCSSYSVSIKCEKCFGDKLPAWRYTEYNLPSLTTGKETEGKGIESVIVSTKTLDLRLRLWLEKNHPDILEKILVILE